MQCIHLKIDLWIDESKQQDSNVMQSILYHLPRSQLFQIPNFYNL
jgi:hypothetical protein